MSGPGRQAEISPVILIIDILSFTDPWILRGCYEPEIPGIYHRNSRYNISKFKV